MKRQRDVRGRRSAEPVSHRGRMVAAPLVVMCVVVVTAGCSAGTAGDTDASREEDMTDQAATPDGAYDDPVPVHTVGGQGDLRLGLADVRDGYAHVQFYGPSETYGGRHAQGEHVIFEHWDIEFLEVADAGATFRVRELDARPDTPAADSVRLPGGSRGYGRDVRVTVSRLDDSDELNVRVATHEDEQDQMTVVGDTITILDHQVTLVDRDGDDVHIRVVDPDGHTLPRPPDE